MFKRMKEASYSGDVTALQEACQAAKSFAKSDFERHSVGNLCIRLAAQHGHLGVVRYLSESALSEPSLGINAAYGGNWPIQSAAYCIRRAAVNGDVGMVQYLCEQSGVDPARVLRMDRPSPAVLDIVNDALAQRCRWSPRRATWLGAVVVAAAAVASGGN